MRRLKNFGYYAVIVLLSLSLVQAGEKREVRVFAASSLSDALAEICHQFEKETGTRVYLNLGGSHMLARQIEEGARADLFFSADSLAMDKLQEKRLIENESRQNLLSNQLVVIVPLPPLRTLAGWEDLMNLSNPKIALGETDTVPAGIYAKKFLVAQMRWEQLKSGVIPLENVRSVLAAVESGNVDWGVVYRTDAKHSQKVKVLAEIPVSDTPEIVYPVAVLHDSKQKDEAYRLLEYLNLKANLERFERDGFITLTPKRAKAEDR